MIAALLPWLTLWSAVQPDNGDVLVPGWLVSLSPLIVALIGALALVVVRLIRGPVTIQDLWAENRKLREDLTTVQGQVRGLMRASNTQLSVNRIMGEGFDALSNAVERSAVPIHYTPHEHEAIDRARALRSDDDLWFTLEKSALTTETEQT